MNMHASASCSNGVKKICQQKKKKKFIFFHACKFVTSCCDENVLHDSTIRGEKKEKKKLYDDVATSY